MHSSFRLVYTVCFVSVLGLVGCGGGGDGGGGDLSGAAGGLGDTGGIVGDHTPYTVDCSAASAYNPASAPIVTAADNGMATTSIILMHGKTGSPLYYGTLVSELAALNYDVIAPYMPWSGLTWDGTMCEGMLYINDLAQAEIDAGRSVVVMGHSMGGAHAVLHETIRPNVAIDAYIPLAPGHFPHRSRKIREAAAAGIALAEEMVSRGDGNEFATFDLLSNGNIIQVSATAYAFLSFHRLDLYPDVDQALPDLTRPVLWLSGNSDPLTTNQSHASLSSNITSAHSEYHEISGDHYTMLDNVPAAAQTWLSGLGL